MQNPYDILGVSPDCSEEELKSAYRKLAKQYHPDLHPGDETAAQKMNEINAAYQQIKTPSSSPGYTSYGTQGYTNYSYGAQPGTDYDPFADMFRGYQQQNYSYRRVNVGGIFLRIILFILVFRIIGFLLLGGLGFRSSYRSGYGASPYYYYYYYSSGDTGEEAPDTHQSGEYFPGNDGGESL